MKNLAVSILFLLFSICANAEITPLSWRVGYAEKYGEEPSEYFPATVPGAVQLDIGRGKKLPEPDYADNVKKYEFLEDCYFTYRTSFAKPKLDRNRRLFFVSKGIDYKFDIIFNGKKIFSQEGMFTPVDIELTDILAENNELKLVVHPAPKSRGKDAKLAPADFRAQADGSFKPPVNYGWDWNPRMVCLGIWDETGLEIRNGSFIGEQYFSYVLSDDLKTAKLSLEFSGKSLKGCIYQWRLLDANGNVAAERSGRIDSDRFSSNDEGVLENPNLWWTHDHGKPYLYTFNLKLFDSEKRELQNISEKVGFKKLSLVLNDGEYQGATAKRGERPAYPMQILLNNRRIFAKGSNWVNPELYNGTITRERYETLVKYGREANFNIFRCWGGALVNKESFFEACDKYGILVWQEFPLACNNYKNDDRYLDVLEREAASIVRRVRRHASLAMWCGGNELFQGWSRMDDQSYALRLLNAICYKFDRKTPFLYTSPMNGVMHGPYYFFHPRDKKTMINYFRDFNAVAYTEFGVPSISPIEVIKKVIPEDELSQIKPTKSWIAHHGFDAFGPDRWLCLSDLELVFRDKPESLEDMVEKSNFLQVQGYKAIFEEARRQKPHCSMVINWCYNDSWRAVANNSIVAYPDIKKPAFEAVKDSCRPVLASARFPKFNWYSGDEFRAELALLNDSFKEVGALDINAYVLIDGKKTKVLTWNCPSAEANKNVLGPQAAFVLPDLSKTDRFDFLLEVDGHPEYNSKYSFAVKKGSNL